MVEHLRSLRAGQRLAYPPDGIGRLPFLVPHDVISYGRFGPAEIELVESFCRLHGIETPSEDDPHRFYELEQIYEVIIVEGHSNDGTYEKALT